MFNLMSFHDLICASQERSVVFLFFLSVSLYQSHAPSSSLSASQSEMPDQNMAPQHRRDRRDLFEVKQRIFSSDLICNPLFPPVFSVFISKLYLIDIFNLLGFQTGLFAVFIILHHLYSFCQGSVLTLSPSLALSLSPSDFPCHGSLELGWLGLHWTEQW